MEIVLSNNPVSHAVDYIRAHYPYCDIGIVGRFDELERLLEKGGNRVIKVPFENAETARFIVAVGGDEEVDFAKSKCLPYMVISSSVPLSAFHKFGIYSFQKMEYGYPNIVIFNNNQNEYLFQAEVRILILSAYVECLNVLGSGLKGQRQKIAENLLPEIRSSLAEFRTIEELLMLGEKCAKELDGFEFILYLNKLLSIFHPENNMHARFYALFSLLYLERRFTNIDFWVILPYMDEVRVRMLAEAHDIKVPISTRRNADVSFLLLLVKKHIPCDDELECYLNGFRLEAGIERVNMEAVLTAIILAGKLCPKKEMIRVIVESGYLDALIP